MTHLFATDVLVRTKRALKPFIKKWGLTELVVELVQEKGDPVLLVKDSSLQDQPAVMVQGDSIILKNGEVITLSSTARPPEVVLLEYITAWLKEEYSKYCDKCGRLISCPEETPVFVGNSYELTYPLTLHQHCFRSLSPAKLLSLLSITVKGAA